MQEMENKLEIKEGKISELQHVLDVRENACKEHMQLLQHTREEN